jgi:hypothetical protein
MGKVIHNQLMNRFMFQCSIIIKCHGNWSSKPRTAIKMARNNSESNETIALQ